MGCGSSGSKGQEPAKKKDEKKEDVKLEKPETKKTDKPAATIPAEKPKEEKKAEAVKADETKAKEPEKKKLSEAEKIADKFVKVNHYLTDEKALNDAVEKKYESLNWDRSEEITHDELKKFIADTMGQKELPPPDEAKVHGLLEKYDKDNSGKLSKKEFKKMFFDIFKASREMLVEEYVAAKYKKFLSKPVAGDKKKADDLKKLLKSTHLFYKKLGEVAKEVDKDKSETLDLVETTNLVEVFCKKYDCPTFTKEEILEFMADFKRDVKVFNLDDLHLISYAVLSVSVNVVLKP